MRPTFVRVLTAALASAGTAGAIALPTLTLGASQAPGLHTSSPFPRRPPRS